VTVLPSLNSTESYGLVHVESILCGTPVVASNLPGIRIPTQETGCGLTFPAGDSQALAKALIRVLSNKQEFNGHSDRLIQLSAPEQVAMEYEKIFTSLVGASDEITIHAASKNQADN
jgi:glycosyltransferase involved in cell wall biosynthesis